MDDLNRAVYHLETALRIPLRSLASENHVDISKLQYNVGMMQFGLGNHTKTLKITQKALENQLKRLPENAPILAHTYLFLSEIYQKENDQTTALDYMEIAIEVARISILPHNKFAFQCFQNQMDLLKNNPCNGGLGFLQPDKNLSCFSDNVDQQDHLLSIHCEELTHTSPDDILQRLSLLNTIGAIYSRKENYQMAMKYFDEAVELFNKNQTSDRFFPQQLEDLMVNIYFGMSRKQESLLLAEIYHAMGLSYNHKLDIFMAIHYLELAISTGMKEFPNGHSRIQIYLGHLQQLKPTM